MITSVMLKTIFSLLVSFSFCKEGGGHEAPAAASEGHGEKPGAPVATEKPWAQLMAQVMIAKATRNQSLSNFTKIKHDLQHLKEGTPELQEQLKELDTEYKKYRKATEEYNQQLSLLKYKFPDRSAKEKIDLNSISIESKEEMSQAVDIDSRLGRAMKKARTKFGGTASQVTLGTKKSAEEKKSELKNIRDDEPMFIEK